MNPQIPSHGLQHIPVGAVTNHQALKIQIALLEQMAGGKEVREALFLDQPSNTQNKPLVSWIFYWMETGEIDPIIKPVNLVRIPVAGEFGEMSLIIIRDRYNKCRLGDLCPAHCVVCDRVHIGMVDVAGMGRKREWQGGQPRAKEGYSGCIRGEMRVKMLDIFSLGKQPDAGGLQM